MTEVYILGILSEWEGILPFSIPHLQRWESGPTERKGYVQSEMGGARAKRGIDLVPGLYFFGLLLLLS